MGFPARWSTRRRESDSNAIGSQTNAMQSPPPLGVGDQGPVGCEVFYYLGVIISLVGGIAWCWASTAELVSKPIPEESSVPDNEEPSTIDIGDRVWFDTNADGLQDDSEGPAIPGVTVTLEVPGGPSQVTTTDAQGNYLFTDVPQSADVVLHFDYATADTSGLPGQG